MAQIFYVSIHSHSNPDSGKIDETLTIEAPLADSVETRSETLVSGKTKPRAIVVVETLERETVVVANDEGAFATKIILSEGKTISLSQATLIQLSKHKQLLYSIHRFHSNL